MKSIGLNRTQLKIIAIISMVIDHIAWGFVDFYSPLGQLLHVCGRLTVPIMCFFIAEGFTKTKDLKRYIFRMAAFAAISIIPFYLFFHEEYGYRQNIIFDLLLGLLLLTVLESKKLKKWNYGYCGKGCHSEDIAFKILGFLESFSNKEAHDWHSESSAHMQELTQR